MAATQSKTPQSETLEEATARMLINTDTWPHFVLPVKNIKETERGAPTVGVVNGIMAIEGKVEIVIGNMYDDKMDWSKAERRQYPSVDAAIVAGWRVD